MNQFIFFWNIETSPVAQMVKNLPAMQETWVQSLGREDPLEKGMAAHSSILAWRTPWREEPGRLPSVGSQRTGHDWVTNTLLLGLLHFYSCKISKLIENYICPIFITLLVNATEWRGHFLQFYNSYFLLEGSLGILKNFLKKHAGIVISILIIAIISKFSIIIPH